MNAPVFLDVRTVKAQIQALRYFHPELDDDAKLLEDSLEGETGLHEVVTRLLRLERNAETFADAIKVQEDALSERRARFVRQKETYRTMIQALMETAGQNKLALPEATLSISKGRAGCIVTDETILPDEFVRVERVPKKAEITAAILAGERVPGAELRNSQSHLSIRT